MGEPNPDAQQIAVECEALCRYLSGRPPTDYVRAQYLAAHQRSGVVEDAKESQTDALLVRFARRGPRGAALADAYAGLFARQSVVRRKIVLLLAILESAAPTSEWVDSVTIRSRFALAAHLVVDVVFFVTRAVAAAVLIGAQLAVGRIAARFGRAAATRS
jgi:hypothetical protein